MNRIDRKKRNMSSQTQRDAIPPFVVKATTIASLGGLLYGFDLGCISGALPQITNAFELTERQSELVVSFLYIGGGLGSAIGGSLCDTGGRRAAILVTDVVFLLGAAILYLSPSLTVVLLGRIVMGFGVAVSAIADVSYLHEISPPEWRGSIVSVNEACISLGFLVAYIVGYFVTSVDPVEGWRSIFGLSGFIAVIQFIGMLAMPESPVWLREQGRKEEADDALMMINGGNGWIRGGSGSGSGFVDEDCVGDTGETPSTLYASIDDSHPQREIPVDDDRNPASRIIKMWRDTLESIKQYIKEMYEHRRQVTIAVFLAVAQQFCGHTNILNYAPEITQQIGFDSASKYTLGITIIIGTIKFVITCFVIWRIEFLGRRSLLLGGLLTIAVSTMMLSITFWHQERHGQNEYMNSFSATVALVGMVGVAAGYAASFAPLTWLLISELFHTKFRGRALGSSTIITYLSAAIVSFCFFSIQKQLGPSVPFTIYFAVSVLSTIFAALAVPDTGGKDPDEIEVHMKKMRFWRWVHGETSLWGRSESQAYLVGQPSGKQMQLV